MRGYFLACTWLFCAACGGTQPSPTSPSSGPSPSIGNAPAVQLQVKVDDLGSRDAIVSLSDVGADASSSSGSGALTFSLDFGDGFVASSATARHTYTTPGTFTITAIVTDAQSRKATDSREVVVKSLTGSWFEAEYVQRTRRVEVRRLMVTAQDGATLRGRYEVTSNARRAFTGTLTAPRSVRITLDDGASLDGVVPSRLNDEAENWILQAHGDTVDGERLAFRPIVGDVGAPPPDADFTVRFGNTGLRQPIAAITPIDIDATLSRGSGLTYFVEFGDGYVTSDPRAIHVVDAADERLPGLAARVTVVDRLGRVDAESLRYSPFSLNGLPQYGRSWGASGWPRDGVIIKFESRAGVDYTGFAGLSSLAAGGVVYYRPARATLSGDAGVRVTLPDAGIEFRGTLDVTTYPETMTLVQYGGTDSGRTWVLRLHDSY